MSNLQSRIRSSRRKIPQVATLASSFPAPILGWNARDPLGDMDPRFATIMDNYFPDGTGVRLRRGYQDHVTGFVSQPVQTLHTAVFGQTDKLVAFVGGAAYDVTNTSQTPPAPLATGFSIDYWSGINAGTKGNELAIFANGSDPVQQWDNSTWQASGLSGPTKFGQLAVSKKRIWATEFGTGEAWYWPAEAVTGAGAKFDVQSVVPRGGELIAIGSLTIDGGNGPDDLTAFIMRSGQVILYAGTDPADSAAWALVGVWQAGEPLDYRCLVPFGNDLILMTDAGFQSLNQFTQTGRIAGSVISDNIKLAVEDAARAFSGLFPWSGIYYPFGRQLQFLVPVQGGLTTHQYVMNTATGAWSRFIGQNPFSHALRQNGDLFFGALGKVVKADVGGLDGGNAIAGDFQTAWNYLGSRGRRKHFKNLRPNIFTNAAIELNVGFGVDFNNPEFTNSATTPPPDVANWDGSNWNEGIWGPATVVVNKWRGAGRTGFNAAVRYKTITQNTDVEFFSTDLNYELGGFT